ncbi:MAG: hypothetical protein REI45_14305, partial [Propionicimonas sp.]|nr:hypothetical protein [Propionicimonas sp.]
DLADLHDQLPPLPQLDDASELVVKAAERTGASIDTIEYGEIKPFAARDTKTVFEDLPESATNLGGSQPAAEPAAEADPDDAADPASEPTAGSTGESAAGADQLQFPITISVIAPDQAAVFRFLDELRAGPRLLQITTVNSSTEEGQPEIELKIEALVFTSLVN